MTDKKTDEKIIEIPKTRSIPVSSDDILRKAGIPESEIR